MRRGFGRPARPGFGAAQIPPALRHANQLMAAGDFAGAAGAFEDLAQRAEARNGPRTPAFLMQAGRARLQMGDAAAAVEHFKHALNLLAQTKRFTWLYRAGTRTVQDLKTHGLEKEAQEISALVSANVPAGNVPAGPQNQTRPPLPTHCPACGGPVRSDEADWIDEQTAECPFCGSPVRAEQ